MSEKKVKPTIEVAPRSPMQILLDIAHGPAYPFCISKIVKTNKKETFVQEIKLKPKFYDFLLKTYGTDEIVLYCNLAGGGIEAWSTDMQLTFKLMNRIGLMSSTKEWVIKSRPYISAFLSEKTYTIPVPEDVKQRLTKAAEILAAAKILMEIQERSELITIARDVATSGTKDPDSTIYRLAMMIFHSERLTKEPAVKAIEDPGTIYLELSQNKEFLEKYSFILEEFKKIPMPARTPAMKTFMSFVTGAYLYYRSLI